MGGSANPSQLEVPRHQRSRIVSGRSRSSGSSPSGTPSPRSSGIGGSIGGNTSGPSISVTGSGASGLFEVAIGISFHGWMQTAKVAAQFRRNQMARFHTSGPFKVSTRCDHLTVEGISMDRRHFVAMTTLLGASAAKPKLLAAQHAVKSLAPSQRRPVLVRAGYSREPDGTAQLEPGQPTVARS